MDVVHFSLYLPQASRGVRDDKGEGGASIWCDGCNDSLTGLVHTLPNLPQASRAAPCRDDNSFVLLTFPTINLRVVHSTLRACDFFDLACSSWPESLEEHLPKGIAGVLRLRA